MLNIKRSPIYYKIMEMLYYVARYATTAVCAHQRKRKTVVGGERRNENTLNGAEVGVTSVKDQVK